MLLIKNGLVVADGSSPPRRADIFIKDGRVAPLSEAPASLAGVQVIDASGLIVAPGLVDMHVHFRDPGQTHKEDILTGAAAAAAGGVTTAACMPNTSPVLDSPELISDLVERAKNAPITILPYGAVTVGQRGVDLTDFAALKAAGAVALSDDGATIMDASVMRRALRLAAENGLFISSHCEDKNLAGSFSVNEGDISRRLSLPGRPAAAEEIIVARDALLSRETGARVHIAHVSSAGSAEIIRAAKKAGAPVTAETCPHYLMLTDEEVLRQGAMAKVNPPLRTRRDIEALIEALADGTIDAIATDHAPHALAEKLQPLEKAPSGFSGLETSLAATLTALHQSGALPIERIVALMSSNPARILGIPKGRIAVGEAADIVIFDPAERWEVDPERFFSKGRNTPFAGMELSGRVKCTIAGGKIVYRGESHVD